MLTKEHPETADITVTTSGESFRLHKFILSARSPYFSKKLEGAPETNTWKLPTTIPPQAFGTAIKYLYLGELPRDLGGGPGTGYTDSEVLAGVDKISKHLEIQSLSQLILDSGDRRLARQRRADEMERGRDQLEGWFRKNVLQHAVETDTEKADDVKWDRDNAIFADVLLRADEDEQEDEIVAGTDHQERTDRRTNALGIPLDSQPSKPEPKSRAHSRSPRPQRSKLFPCHRAMLIRSEFFLKMFSSSFREAQNTTHLQIIPIACSPTVLEIILTFLYTEKADFSLDIAVDVLFAADLLFLEKLKMRAAVVISTLGNGTATAIPSTNTDSRDEESIDIYEILHAAWLTRVQRLEEFAARYIAYRLESYIDDPDFAEIVKESAGRISARQETDTIELLDDIRWYLSERFRLRFEDSGLEDMMHEEQQQQQWLEGQAGQDSQQLKTFNGEGRTDDPSSQPIPHWGSGPVLEGAQDPTPNHDDEAIDMRAPADPQREASAAAGVNLGMGEVRTLDGELAGDEFASDAINYQILLGKIDRLLERLKLDA